MCAATVHHQLVSSGDCSHCSVFVPVWRLHLQSRWFFLWFNLISWLSIFSICFPLILQFCSSSSLYVVACKCCTSGTLLFFLHKVTHVSLLQEYERLSVWCQFASDVCHCRFVVYFVSHFHPSNAAIQSWFGSGSFFFFLYFFSSKKDAIQTSSHIFAFMTHF